MGATKPPTPKPEIVVNGRHLRDITAEALGVLTGLKLYSRGGVVVRVNGGRAQPLTNAALKGILERSADFVKETRPQGTTESVLTPARVPSDVAADILSLPADTLPFLKLRAIATSPVLLPSGKLLSRDGYDADSRILLQLEGLSGLRHDMGVTEAVGWIEELLGNFPFVDDASRAHAYCLLIQPTVRHSFRGQHPSTALTRRSGAPAKACSLTCAALCKQVAPHR